MSVVYTSGNKSRQMWVCSVYKRVCTELRGSKMYGYGSGSVLSKMGLQCRRVELHCLWWICSVDKWVMGMY